MKNEPSITIICSLVDKASQNIKDHLLASDNWHQIKYPEVLKTSGICSIYESSGFRIVELDKHHIHSDGIDKKLHGYGFTSTLLIFASKHRSKDERRLLTTHFTGNTGTADYGGNPHKLAVTAPYAMRSILTNIKKLSENMDYEVSLEATHHGPSELITPSVYVEIGSTENQWVDPEPGRIIADAILSVEPNNCAQCPVALGFGGGHYAKRQSKLLFETNITFGHIFPDYQLEDVDINIVKQAIDKSNPDFVYFDRKSMSTRERNRIMDIVESLGMDILRESDIREMSGVSWQFFKQLYEKAMDICPNGNLKLTDRFKNKIQTMDFKDLSVEAAIIDENLLKEAEKNDKIHLNNFLQNQGIAYIENANGTLGNVILDINRNNVNTMANELVNECIILIKKNHEIEYSPEGNVLYIVKKRFNSELARELGVPDGPMFGKLAKGQPVTVNGKYIEPEMVYEIDRKSINLNTMIT
ncbi:D-aminoacyl-tRNA deacylase [Methanohalobium sp.]|uniref:D-aminoacyl-tRNA deacylase n=1 Tax=Methanohalobium sp. TaxID=2837493 RepID=UPI00397AA3A5